MGTREGDAALPVINWTPIRCPRCGSRRRRDVRRRAGDRVSYHRCVDCEQRFKAVAVEADEPGTPSGVAPREAAR